MLIDNRKLLKERDETEAQCRGPATSGKKFYETRPALNFRLMAVNAPPVRSRRIVPGSGAAPPEPLISNAPGVWPEGENQFAPPSNERA